MHPSVSYGFGLNERARTFARNPESHQPEFESLSDDYFSELLVHNFESYSSSLSPSSFPSSCDVSMFSNELYDEEKSNDIEQMLTSLGIEDGRDNVDTNPESTGLGYHSPGNANLNQLMLAQAYLAALNSPWAVPPLQYQTQSGVPALQMPFGASLPGNLSVPSNQAAAANPVFVIIPPIDSSSLLPKFYPSSEQLKASSI